jgi:tetratricopeptide (TPR) repeat protein
MPETTPESSIEPMLADANRLRARGELQAAEKRCRDALLIAPGNPAAHELLGDIFYQRGGGGAGFQPANQRRMQSCATYGAQAIESYRRARAANPQRAMLEDKIARASLLVAEAEIVRAQAQELLAGKRLQTPRRPGVSALLSLVAPGFGQIYNGEHVKGAALVCVWLLLLLGAAVAALGSMRAGPAAAGAQWWATGLGALVGLLFARPALWWTLLAIALWLYGITDAALRAAKTMTAPEDLA